uniref:Alkyl transferase n=2 Tax=Paulinella micropora TaxID=1928728 RepID=A0A1L5YCW7_9EUKA|nr:Undecaprenyl pyrophosphate synthetase (UPPS) [Paulinella micropora]AQX45312.1 Undecaprenyl pyrophosphate synthetase [Paulinella micropora]
MTGEELFLIPKGLDPIRMPSHIAVIMDGNGRWAQRRGLPRIMGHRAGVEALKRTLSLCNEWGIHFLTAYAFSTENWNRPSEEVGFLMILFERILEQELKALEQKKVCIQFLGDLNVLPERLQLLIDSAIERTAKNEGVHFNICLNYGARKELVQVAQILAERSKLGLLEPSSIDEFCFAAELQTAGQPDPDLLIRTSGELRLSNFLLWQLAYSEIHVTDSLWPDFDREDLLIAVENFQARHRRFGGMEYANKL